MGIIVFIVLILSFFAFIKTLGYAIYEYKDLGNKFNGIVCFVFSVISLVGPAIVVVIR